MLGAIVFLAAVLGIPSPSNPAFLDSLKVIHVALDRPKAGQEISVPVSVTLDGARVAVESVRPAGEAEKERRMPRSTGRVVLPGTLQGALGGRDWDPDGEETQMTEVSPGKFELVVKLPAGAYEFKIARGGSWSENYGAGFVAGGGNYHLTVPRKEPVKFVVDFTTKSLRDSIDDASTVSAPTSLPPVGPAAPHLKYRIAEVTLTNALSPTVVAQDLEVHLGDGGRQRVFARDVLDAAPFVYTGPLGTEFSKTATMFRTWSPVSKSVSVRLYGAEAGSLVRTIPMRRGRYGEWTIQVPGNISGKYYDYEYDSYGERRIAPDIYGRSASFGSRRSQVVDLASPRPSNVASNFRGVANPVDAIVYEASVRDFTISPSSGVPATERGKYAGLGRSGTRSPSTGSETGLDYLRHLGVTHVQLLPIQDFLLSPGEYSWGYATYLFNVPEESYGMRPADRIDVIRELKGMISNVHRAGLGVVMDVVYNHTWPPEGPSSPFWEAVPYYYFRTDLAGKLLNESGVGNAFDDDRPMARKYVQDSLLYWQKEYCIDGFRFDLLGMFRRASVAQWAYALRRQNPRILIYGEPWTGGGPTRFGKGTQRNLGVGVFNDDFRTVFRGDLDGTSAGFAAGGGASVDALRRAINGSTTSDGFASAPGESINYVSAHDNLTLIDRLRKSVGNDSELRSSLKLSLAAVLLCQGVPFLEGAVELGRTKGGNGNSYNAGDRVNQFDWDNAAKYRDVSNYLARLIAIRKAEPGLRLRTANEIQERVHFLELRPDFVSFSVDERGLGGSHSQLVVVLNGTKKSVHYALPSEDWRNLFADRLRVQSSNHKPVDIPPLATSVFAR